MNINKFAAFISFLTSVSGNTFDAYQVETVASYVEQLNEAPKGNYVDCSVVDQLLNAMGREGQKIEAIKQYRTLTGADLRTSKDAVEKYWMKNNG